MVRLKSKPEIETLAEGGKILATLLDELEKRAVVGATPAQLDEYARQFAAQKNVKLSFLGYASKSHKPYPAGVCISVNAGIVHGLPTDTPFEEGDVVGIDAGIASKGLYLDSARTVGVGKVSREAQHLLSVTRKALDIGIQAAQIGNTTGHIGEAVQKYVEAEGLGVVRQLVGHGVGYAVHEEPQVPNFGKAGGGQKLEEGLVIAIEPMVTIGDPKVVTADDGWTVRTASGNLAAHFEHTVAITKEGPRVLTESA